MGGPDWLYFTLAGILGVLSLWLFYRGLFADRSRGRKRCPKCFYDLSAAKNNTCSECGRVIRKPRHYHKTRRYKGRTALALLCLLLAGAAGFFPHARRIGQPRMLPDTILIWLLPTVESDSDPIWIELRRRITADLGYRRWLAESSREARSNERRQRLIDDWPELPDLSTYWQLGRTVPSASWWWRGGAGSGLCYLNDGESRFLECLSKPQRRALARSCGRIIARDQSRVLTDQSMRIIGALGDDGGRGVPAIADGFKDGSIIDEQLALLAIASVGREATAAVPILCDRLEEHDWRDPGDANLLLTIAALGEIGPGAVDAVPFLRRGAASQESSVSSACARALGRIGPEAADALPTLVEIVRHDGRNAASSAIVAITRIGPQSEDAGRVILRTALSRSPDLQQAAIDALRPHAELQMEAASCLRDLLDSEEPSDRLRALRGLAQLGEQHRVSIDEMADRLLHDDAIIVRYETALTLVRWASAGNQESAAALDQCLEEGGPATRTAIRLAGWRSPEERGEEPSRDTSTSP